jgi:hypothetical protein
LMCGMHAAARSACQPAGSAPSESACSSVKGPRHFGAHRQDAHQLANRLAQLHRQHVAGVHPPAWLDNSKGGGGCLHRRRNGALRAHRAGLSADQQAAAAGTSVCVRQGPRGCSSGSSGRSRHHACQLPAASGTGRGGARRSESAFKQQPGPPEASDALDVLGDGVERGCSTIACSWSSYMYSYM